jgi:peroxiredoxin
MIGEQPPDVVLMDRDARPVHLSELLGRPLVLVFLRWLG